MSLPPNLFATAFRQHRLGLVFTAIMASMVYLATLAMAVPASLAQTSLSWNHTVAGRLTLEIPPPSEDDTAALPQPERVRQITAALHAMPDIAKIEPVPAAEITRLMKPWMSDATVLATLPLPSLIDVQTIADKPLDAETLRQRLTSIAKDIHVDRHADWLEQVVRVTQGLSLLAILTVLLAGFTLVMVIGLICRAAMAVQHETIELLHLLGATDADVARQFQRHVFRLSWPAALMGFLGAALTVGILGTLLRFFVDQPALSLGTFAITLALVPLLSVTGAALTARLSVTRLLQRMP